jgi:hypothetical protein
VDLGDLILPQSFSFITTYKVLQRRPDGQLHICCDYFVYQRSIQIYYPSYHACPDPQYDFTLAVDREILVYCTNTDNATVSI